MFLNFILFLDRCRYESVKHFQTRGDKRRKKVRSYWTIWIINDVFQYGQVNKLVGVRV